MAEESNDTRNVETFKERSPEKRSLSLSPTGSTSFSPSSSEDKSRKKTSSVKTSNKPRGYGLYTVIFMACTMVFSTFGDFLGFHQSLKGSFTYSIAGVNPMEQYINQSWGWGNTTDHDGQPAKPAGSNGHSVAMCVVQKQTTQYFEEWLLYHKALGFDKVYVYDNVDEPEFQPWLDKQSKEIQDMVGNVTVWPGVKQQVKVYLDCWRRIRDAKRHSWIAFFDVDEYLVIKDMDKYPTIMKFLDTLPGHQYGLTVNWVQFKFNGLMKYEDKPVTLRFQNHSVEPVAGAVKTIVRAQVSPKMKNPHFVKYKLDRQTTVYMSRDSRGNVVTNYENPHLEVRDVGLYHYCTKSLEEYKQRCGRGDVLRAQSDWKDMLPCQPDQVILDKWGTEEPIHDDRPWKLLQERVPEYTKRYTST